MKNSEMYYTGTIVEVLDPILYEIIVDIPGIIQGVKAFPFRGEIDEPKVGDFVLLRCLDPIFQSYYLYQKIKENDFIGFRSNGKSIDITPEYIQIGVFDPNTEYTDTGDKNYRPTFTDWIKIDSSGKIEASFRSDSKIVISGKSEVEISGESSVKIGGNVNLKVDGNTVLDCPSVKITGGKLEVAGTSSTDTSGPFNCIPVCPFSGAPHSGKIVSGT